MTDKHCKGAHDARGAPILCTTCKRNEPPQTLPVQGIAPAAKQDRRGVWGCINLVERGRG